MLCAVWCVSKKVLCDGINHTYFIWLLQMWGEAGSRMLGYQPDLAWGKWFWNSAKRIRLIFIWIIFKFWQSKCCAQFRNASKYRVNKSCLQPMEERKRLKRRSDHVMRREGGGVRLWTKMKIKDFAFWAVWIHFLKSCRHFFTFEGFHLG